MTSTKITLAVDEFAKCVQAAASLSLEEIQGKMPVVQDAWGSATVFSGSLDEMRKLVYDNLREQFEQPGFRDIQVDVRGSDCTQISVFFESFFKGIRAWREHNGSVYVVGYPAFRSSVHFDWPPVSTKNIAGRLAATIDEGDQQHEVISRPHPLKHKQKHYADGYLSDSKHPNYLRTFTILLALVICVAAGAYVVMHKYDISSKLSTGGDVITVADGCINVGGQQFCRGTYVATRSGLVQLPAYWLYKNWGIALAIPSVASIVLIWWLFGSTASGKGRTRKTGPENGSESFNSDA